MSHAEWKDVLNLALAVIAREPPPIPVFIFLFTALAAVLVAEGIRTVFFRPMARAIADAPAIRLPRLAKKEAAAAGGERSQAFEMRPRKFTPRQNPVFARNPKRQIVELRRFSPPRPQIRRTGAYTMAVESPSALMLETPEQSETGPSL